MTYRENLPCMVMQLSARADGQGKAGSPAAAGFYLNHLK
jgi:hypothetical protein